MSQSISSRMYKASSIIYFEGDKSECIYILKSGRLILKSINLNTGEEVVEGVKLGEFFGVKSALGRYPREETAQTIDDTVVLVLTLQDFEKLVLKNVEVVKKMLRVFSNQLRRIHKNVRSAMASNDVINPATELYKIGEYYYKAGIGAKASYAFKKFLDYYPDDELAAEAVQRIAAIKNGQFDVQTPKPSQVEQVQDSDPDIANQDLQGLGDSSFDSSDPFQTAAGSDPFSSGGGLADDLSSFLSDDPFSDKGSGF